MRSILFFLLPFLFIISPVHVSAEPLSLGRGMELRDSVLEIGAGVEKIGDYQFRDCTQIKEIRFAEGIRLRSIGDYAFWGCSNLREIKLPATVLTIGEGAFRECESLEKVGLPDKIESLPPFLFYFCESLKDVTIPTGVKKIGRSAV